MGIYDFAHLPETFQQSWSGLENVGGLNLVHMAIADGGNGVPTRPLTNRVEVGLLATPTRNNNVRLATDDFIAGHDTVGCARTASQFRENVLAAGRFNRFAHPSDSADERVIPFLEINL